MRVVIRILLGLLLVAAALGVPPSPMHSIRADVGGPSCQEGENSHHENTAFDIMGMGNIPGEPPTNCRMSDGVCKIGWFVCSWDCVDGHVQGSSCGNPVMCNCQYGGPKCCIGGKCCDPYFKTGGQASVRGVGQTCSVRPSVAEVPSRTTKAVGQGR